MLHEKPVRSCPLRGDVDAYDAARDDAREARKAWKRRRKCLAQSSSSDDPTDATQGHQAPFSDAATTMALLGEDEEEINELFGPEVILSEEDQATFVKLLRPDIPPPDPMTVMSSEDHYALKERHGRFRIAYYKALKLQYSHELKDLDAYSEHEIRKQNCFKHLENDEYFEWFFHSDDDWNPDLDDYQRIVLKSILPDGLEILYPDVNSYHERYHTYEMDVVYLKYHGELSKKIKWIEAYLDLDQKSAEWTEISRRGWRQALRIATRLPDMTLDLAYLGYYEFISELREDASLKDLEDVYFLIWRLVVRDKIKYMDAVKQVYEMDKFHIHKRAMDVELKKGPTFLTMRQKILFITQRAGISAETDDDKAKVLFREGLVHFKTKYMVNYAKKKLEIAKVLNWHKSTDVPGRID